MGVSHRNPLWIWTENWFQVLEKVLVMDQETVLREFFISKRF